MITHPRPGRSSRRRVLLIVLLAFAVLLCGMACFVLVCLPGTRMEGKQLEAVAVPVRCDGEPVQAWRRFQWDITDHNHARATWLTDEVNQGVLDLESGSLSDVAHQDVGCPEDWSSIESAAMTPAGMVTVMHYSEAERPIDWFAFRSASAHAGLLPPWYRISVPRELRKGSALQSAQIYWLDRGFVSLVWQEEDVPSAHRYRLAFEATAVPFAWNGSTQRVDIQASERQFGILRIEPTRDGYRFIAHTENRVVSIEHDGKTAVLAHIPDADRIWGYQVIGNRRVVLWGRGFAIPAHDGWFYKLFHPHPPPGSLVSILDAKGNEIARHEIMTLRGVDPDAFNIDADGTAWIAYHTEPEADEVTSDLHVCHVTIPELAPRNVRAQTGGK